MAKYAHPEVLVSTDWVADRIDNTNALRIVAANEDEALYDEGHIPTAVPIDWVEELQQEVVRDLVDRDGFAALCEDKGISNDTTVVLYSDQNNWWACYAFWIFTLYGHEDVRLMNGGREKWLAEDRPLSTTTPDHPTADYTATEQDLSIRAFRDQVLQHVQAGGSLVDVRSPEEYRGEVRFLPEYPDESTLRAGHIPGASNVPWERSVRDDGTFKSREELEQIYEVEAGLDAGTETMTYCRIGERSSLTWFVLRYLLGFDQVRNYDGSWSEWGNLVGMPIQRIEEGDEVD
jgi:thiosulfate/3-mercaptopyruvate sulfurtransferase